MEDEEGVTRKDKGDKMVLHWLGSEQEKTTDQRGERCGQKQQGGKDLGLKFLQWVARESDAR